MSKFITVNNILDDVDLVSGMVAENPALVQAHIQAQLHQVMAAQLAANGGVVPPAHMRKYSRTL